MKKRLSIVHRTRYLKPFMLSFALLCVGWVLFGTAPAYAVSREEALNWVYAQEGKYLDYDGYYGAQCVDLIKYYYEIFGMADYAMGNGCDYISNTLPPGWTRIQNYAEFVPEPGDVGVWTDASWKNGHVAIILSADVHNFVSMDQNWPQGTQVTQVSHGYNYFWGVIRPAYSTSNHAPECQFDGVETSPGKFTIWGWAFDPDDTSAALNIHVYVYDTAGNPVWSTGSPIANKEGTDVDNVYHCGKYHRFSETFNVNISGTFKIGVAALDTTTGGGGATWRFKENINIPKDSEAPKISGITISNISASGYTVSATITDNVGLSKVQFPTWHTWNPGPIATWYDASKSGNTYSLRVNRDTSKSGYWSDFYGWDGQGNSTESNIRAHLNWHTVTFNPNGGSVSPASKTFIMACLINKDSNKVTTYYTKYSDFGLPTPTRTGYSFDGWYTEASGGTKINAGDYISRASNYTLYARWKANQSYTVTFDPMGGTVSPQSKQVLYLDYYGELPEPKRTGYTFEGWYNAITEGAHITENNIKTTAMDVTLYARWKANQSYTVTFDPMGGTVSPQSKQVLYLGYYGELPDPKRVGYSFEGWYNAVTEGEHITEQHVKTTAMDVTLFARWIPDKYSVVIIDEEGNNVFTDKYHDIDLSLPILANSDEAVFTGYNTRADGTGTAYAPGEPYTDNRAITLYVQYRPYNRLKLPKNLRAIEEQAFEGVSAEIIEIPEGCASIGAKAFLNCEKLVKLYIPASVNNIAFNAFNGCDNLVIYAPKGSLAIEFAERLNITHEITE